MLQMIMRHIYSLYIKSHRFPIIKEAQADTRVSQLWSDHLTLCTSQTTLTQSKQLLSSPPHYSRMAIVGFLQPSSPTRKAKPPSPPPPRARSPAACTRHHSNPNQHIVLVGGSIGRLDIAHQALGVRRTPDTTKHQTPKLVSSSIRRRSTISNSI
jgi:hypothetical protein